MLESCNCCLTFQSQKHAYSISINFYLYKNSFPIPNAQSLAGLIWILFLVPKRRTVVRTKISRCQSEETTTMTTTTNPKNKYNRRNESDWSRLGLGVIVSIQSRFWCFKWSRERAKRHCEAVDEKPEESKSKSTPRRGTRWLLTSPLIFIILVDPVKGVFSRLRALLLEPCGSKSSIKRRNRYCRRCFDGTGIKALQAQEGDGEAHGGFWRVL